jgi:hypothetical protein
MLSTICFVAVFTLGKGDFALTSFELATVPGNYEHPSTRTLAFRAQSPDRSVGITDRRFRSLGIEVESGEEARENS